MIRSTRSLATTTEHPRILLDLDGTLVNWERCFGRELQKLYAAASIRDAAAYDVRDRWYAPAADILEVLHQKLDYGRMRPLDGAVDAVTEMQAAGLDVWICTKNTPENYFCASDKIGWVRKNLGAEMARKTILIHDKTLVSGDILIDDRADIAEGAMTPSWQHVVFDADYNRDMPRSTPRLKSWADWREVLGEVLEMDFSAPSRRAVA